MNAETVEYLLQNWGTPYSVIPPTRHMDKAKVVRAAVKALELWEQGKEHDRVRQEMEERAKNSP